MKKKFLMVASLAALIALLACEEILTTEEAASKASKEMCDCIKNKSRSDCEKELNSNYKTYVNNDDFYKAFNKVNDCGVTIYKKKE